jgi:hypothetical protein
MTMMSRLGSPDEVELRLIRRDLDRLAEARLEHPLSERDSDAYRVLTQREMELLQRLQIDLRVADDATSTA